MCPSTQLTPPYRNPGEVIIEGGEEAATPNEAEDDFFSSWDKPSIKRPTPPPSRTATPPVIGRTSSPLVANKDTIRTSSPLTSGGFTPPVSRTTTSSALRTKAGAGTASSARRTGVLGAKKPQKLGAKKAGAGGDVVDFEEAEKKAKEEAERIAKLGYNPDDEEAPAKEKGKILSPTPVAAESSHRRQSSDAERLGMQMGRLGFGQTAGGAPAKTQVKNTGGFGSVGPIRAAAEGKSNPSFYGVKSLLI